MGNKPEREWAVDASMVVDLLRQQAPAYANLPLRPLASGWDNDTFVLGTEPGARFVVRLPRRQAAVPLIDNEQTWLDELPELPLPIPVPFVRGIPAEQFPRPWSLCRFFEGTCLTETRLADPSIEAKRLGEFLAALHVPAPAKAPKNPFRGIPLRGRDAMFESSVVELRGQLDEGRMRASWEAFRQLPETSRPPTWLHGDLHPSNIIVDDRAIVAVIDFGDICAGDRASDLAVGWMIFDDEAREIFRSAAGAQDDTWQRARGWAFNLALVYAATSGNDPLFHEMALRTIERTTAFASH